MSSIVVYYVLLRAKMTSIETPRLSSKGTVGSGNATQIMVNRPVPYRTVLNRTVLLSGNEP
jgi:hypothetical protein